jgi:thioesterase domain-containing protein
MQRADLGISIPFRPAETDIEQLLSRLMAEALELDIVGIDDDFFQLGGDSLAAENFFLAIETVTGHRLPISILFDRPRIALLAEVLASGEIGPSSAIVKIRGAGSKPPVFLVPGVGGEVIGMEPLARHLDRDRPIYCCKFPGLDHAQRPLDSVEDMATNFLPEIRRLRPTGPYHLLGACFGGLVALEMAQRLRADGAEVGLLCLVDTPLHDTISARSRPSLGVGARFAVNRMRIFARELVHRRGQRMSYVRSKGLRIAATIRRGHLPPETRSEIAKMRVVAANHAASRRYIPRPYGGLGLYVQSGERARGPSRTRRASWTTYFPAGFADHVIACRDSGELFAHHADELARLVSEALRQPEAA